MKRVYKPELKSAEEGTIIYELRKLNKNFPIQDELKGNYNPETNEFLK
jgi:hypothetical protein